MPSAIIDVACAILESDGRVLAARRPAGKAQAGRWEFPGGKKEESETPAEALRRELHEELGIAVAVGRGFPPVVYAYERITIRLHPFLCALENGAEPAAREHSELRWLRPEELRALDWAPADVPVLEHYLAFRL